MNGKSNRVLALRWELQLRRLGFGNQGVSVVIEQDRKLDMRKMGTVWMISAGEGLSSWEGLDLVQSRNSTNEAVSSTSLCL
jgi:hypothetical protein